MTYEPGSRSITLRRRIFLFCVGLIECCIFGGLIFGWPQLVLLLKEEGIYADLCDSSNGTQPQPLASTAAPSTSERCTEVEFQDQSQMVTQKCVAQDERFALFFTISVVMYGLPSILVGYLLHHAGLWVTRFITSLMLIGSFVCFGLLSPDHPFLLLPALVLLSSGGNQIRLAAVQLGDLFPDHRSTAITMLMGSYSVSSSVFYLFQVAKDEGGFSRAEMSWVLLGVSGLSFVSTFAMPVKHISEFDILKSDASTRSSVESATEAISLKESLVSWSSLVHQMWFALNLFALNNYNQIFNYWVTETSCSAEEIKLYTSLFSFTCIVGAFTSPALGALADYILHRLKSSSNSDSPLDLKLCEIKSHFIPLLIVTACTLGLFVNLLFLSHIAIYLSLFSATICRSGIFSSSAAFVRARFPAAHLSRLLGIYGTSSALIGLMQYPFFVWAVKSYNTAMVAGTLAITCCFVYPFHILHKSTRLALENQLKPTVDGEKICFRRLHSR